jgi:hypothetical protein
MPRDSRKVFAAKGSASGDLTEAQIQNRRVFLDERGVDGGAQRFEVDDEATLNNENGIKVRAAGWIACRTAPNGTGSEQSRRECQGPESSHVCLGANVACEPQAHIEISRHQGID